MWVNTLWQQTCMVESEILKGFLHRFWCAVSENNLTRVRFCSSYLFKRQRREYQNPKCRGITEEWEVILLQYRNFISRKNKGHQVWQLRLCAQFNRFQFVSRYIQPCQTLNREEMFRKCIIYKTVTDWKMLFLVRGHSKRSVIGLSVLEF